MHRGPNLGFLRFIFRLPPAAIAQIFQCLRGDAITADAYLPIQMFEPVY
jgi:hypothetical protein